MKRNTITVVTLFLILLSLVPVLASEKAAGSGLGEKALPADKKTVAVTKASAASQEDKLPWWPTDAQPAPVRDEQRGGYWWWPQAPASTDDLWGNRGYAYVNKIIYDWRSRAVKYVKVDLFEVASVTSEEKPSLLVKRTIKSLKLQFKDDAVEIKPEHTAILKKTVGSLGRNKEANVLMTAYTDQPELEVARTQAVETFLVEQGVSQDRINIIAPEKVNEAGLSPRHAPDQGTVLLIIAEVKEVMIPGPK